MKVLTVMIYIINARITMFQLTQVFFSSFFWFEEQMFYRKTLRQRCGVGYILIGGTDTFRFKKILLTNVIAEQIMFIIQGIKVF